VFVARSPDSGTILLDGVDISTLNVRWLRAQFGLVSQEPELFSCSIEDNIRYGLDDDLLCVATTGGPCPTQAASGASVSVGGADGSSADVVAAATAANAADFIDGFTDGYKTLAGAAGSQLSGGQKQRVAIARAVIRRPRLLLFDEATSALDSESERVVQQALDRLARGVTTIAIAHRLSAIRLADVIFVMKNVSGQWVRVRATVGLMTRSHESRLPPPPPTPVHHNFRPLPHCVECVPYHPALAKTSVHEPCSPLSPLSHRNVAMPGCRD
jgi:ABC-type multidrug transport system fused ATPase/permease subunit